MTFLQTFEFALEELEKINPILKDYDSDLDIKKNYDFFDHNLKEKIFKVAFNEKLLKYLWLKIKKTKEDERILQEQIEKEQLGEETPKRTNLNTQNNQFLRAISRSFTQKKSSFSSKKEEELEEGELPEHLKEELALRMRNAFSMGRKQRKNFKKDKMNEKERFAILSQKKKFDLEKLEKFKKTRKKIADEFTRKSYKQGLRFERHGVLTQIEKLSKSAKSPKKKKNVKGNRRKGLFFKRTFTLEEIMEKDDKERRESGEDLMLTQPKAKKERTSILTQRGSAFINKVKALNKFNFYFHPDEAKCIILSFLKENAIIKKNNEN